MHLKELEYFRKLKIKIARISNKIELIKDTKVGIVSDSVKGSSKKLPYQERVVTVTGLNQSDNYIIKRLKNERLQINKIIKSLEPMINDLIASIDDLNIVHIIITRYIDGYSWEETAKRVYGYAGEDAPRKAIQRFFNKTE